MTKSLGIKRNLEIQAKGLDQAKTALVNMFYKSVTVCASPAHNGLQLFYTLTVV